MALKILTAKAWADASKGSDVDGDDFEKALAKYESLAKKEGKPEELLKAIDTIGKLADKLKGQVAKIPKAKKYIADVPDALETEKRAVIKASTSSGIAVTFRNNSGTDIYLWVEDLNAAPNARVILDWGRLNDKKSLELSLVTDSHEEGRVRWKGKATDSAYDVNGEEEKGIKNGKKIDVRPL